MTNLPEVLSREIERVSGLKAIYGELDGKPGVNVRPALAMMQVSLEAAHLAAGSDDVVAMAEAVKDLKGFEE